MSRLDQLRLVDPVLTQVAYGYAQAESSLPFVAPTVNVATRSGKILYFDKSHFAVSSTKRVPYSYHQRSKVSGYGTRNYVLEQHTHTAEVAFEEVEEAANGAAGVDLKELAVLEAVARIEQSLEVELFNLITNPNNFAATNRVAVAAANQFSNGGSDPEALVRNWKSAVRAKTGRYPNKALISEDVYNALTLHPTFRERIKHTSTDTTDLDMLAGWFGLPGGIKVAQRLYLNPATGELEDMFPEGTMLLFIDGNTQAGKLGASTEAAQPVFVQNPKVARTTATFAQLYVLNGGMKVDAERVDYDRDVFCHTVRFEGSVVLTSVDDQSDLSTAGFIATNLI